jgi:hypothetical protein
MLVAVHARVLAQIILVLCFAAGMAASCIIFVLYGPVPVRRKVTIVPRLAPPDPFAQNRAAAIISLPAQPPSVQQQVAPGIAFVLPQGSGSHAAPPVAHAASHVAHVAPLVLRRPRGESPAPLPRNRSARGTERRPRPSELDLDVTAVRARVDHSMSPEDTLDTPLVDPDFIDDQFLEDGR